MIDFMIQNGSTIIVSLIIIGVVFLVIRKLRNDKKRGVTSCRTSCSSCAMAGSCKDFHKDHPKQ
jgi:hypothetical protein